MRSYRPEELFDSHGRLIDELAQLAPEGVRRVGYSGLRRCQHNRVLNPARPTTHRRLGELGYRHTPWIIGESFYDDPQKAAELARAIEATGQ